LNALCDAAALALLVGCYQHQNLPINAPVLALGKRIGIRGFWESPCGSRKIDHHSPVERVPLFRNKSGKVARMLCVCSPPGLEDFVMALGVPVSSRTASTPEQMAERWIGVRPMAARYVRKGFRPDGCRFAF
jgi:hypothetical protein